MNKEETRALLKLLFSISESLKSVAAHYELEHSTFFYEYSEYLSKIDNWYDEDFEEFEEREGLVNGES